MNMMLMNEDGTDAGELFLAMFVSLLLMRVTLQTLTLMMMEEKQDVPCFSCW